VCCNPARSLSPIHAQVLLIERGEDNHNVPSVITPGLAAVHTYTPDSKTIRKYECVKSPRYNNRDMSLIVGNILGGGGSSQSSSADTQFADFVQST
jgi:choline dehydrogenase-like flavoprotein